VAITADPEGVLCSGEKVGRILGYKELHPENLIATATDTSRMHRLMALFLVLVLPATIIAAARNNM